MPEYICRGRAQLQQAANVIACQLSPDKIWRVNVTPYKLRRSGEQNNRAWALYNAVAQETGYTPDEVHSLFKQRFGEPKTVRIGDVEVTEYTTRDRDVAWFSDYLDRCQAFAAQELGVVIG